LKQTRLDDLKSVVRGIVAYSPYGGSQVDLDAVCNKVRDAKELRPAVMKALQEMYPDIKTA